MRLSTEQIKAINHINGPALVLAVPGAGKTTVLIHRTRKLIIEHNINPERILSITFSKSSALDMKDRFIKHFPALPSTLIKFSTIHAFCYNLIREYSYMTKIKFTLIEDDTNPLNKYSLLKKIYMDLNRDHITEEKLDSLLNAIGYTKNMMMTPENYIAENKTDIDNFVKIYNLYDDYKKKNSLLDFDDMLTISLEILKKNRQIMDKYRNKYDYIQLDEGQDTSKIQMTLIKILAFPNNNLFIVADDDQSIYGFRGAYPKGLLDFNKEFANGKLFFMETNYRSTKNIVSMCNNFIKSNTQRYNKEISTENSFLEPINIIKVKTITDQYNLILDEIKGKDLSNVAILYRNNISSIGLIEVLELNNISFYMRDTKLRFFNHWVLQDILNFMKLAQDTSSMEIYETIYYKTKGFISKKQINFAKSLDQNISVFDRIMEYPGLSEFYKKTLRDLKLDFKRLSKLKPIDAISYIEDKLEFDNYLRENSMKFGYTYDNLTNIIFYLKLIAKNSQTLIELVGRLKHLQYLCTNSKSNKNTITLSTIHSAKGLEFDKVYMIDLVDGDFPSNSSVESLDNGDLEPLEEERRLFYVGMTRAKNHLTLITAKSKSNNEYVPSRFLCELENKV